MGAKSARRSSDTVGKEIIVGHRIAVVGSGPSGLYAVQALLRADEVEQVDVLESLPAPYGLLRYGVAPDHPKTKRIARALARVFDDPRVRFLGNVHVGQALSRADLLKHYDAIVYATGARYDRDLGIPGEQLAGSIGAARFVAWYSGHPDVPKPTEWDDTRSLVVVGAGNVALDVSRISLRPSAVLADTDIPRDVLEEFQEGAVSEVHLLCRRGPEHAKFSRVELAELLELPDTRIVLHAEDDWLADRPELSKEVRVNLRLFRQAQEADYGDCARVMHFHFWTVPTEIEGADGSGADGGISGVRIRTAPPGGPVTEDRIEAQAVIRAIGYRGEPIQGLPFDQVRRLIPNAEGEVPGTDGREYVTGWIKRGPTGVIGTNKGDAAETVARLLATLAADPDGVRPQRPDIDGLLKERAIDVVTWEDWHRIRAAEEALGAEHGTTAIKLADREALLAAAFCE